MKIMHFHSRLQVNALGRRPLASSWTREGKGEPEPTCVGQESAMRDTYDRDCLALEMDSILRDLSNLGLLKGCEPVN